MYRLAPPVKRDVGQRPEVALQATRRRMTSMSWARGMMGVALLALIFGGGCSSCPRCKQLQRCPNEPAARAEAEPEPEVEAEPEPEPEEPAEPEAKEEEPPPPPEVEPAEPKDDGAQPANKKVRPPGSGWYCAEARDRGTGTFLGARCNRREAECETAKAKLLDHYKAQGLGARLELGACESRVRADCFTAFDIGYDQYDYFCFDATKDCNAARKNMARKESESYREISRCDAWY